ncbi:MAG: 30S ribosomal protein S16 [Treponema sp.]|nr:30S ribosomal protein S16 [Treponema sp.]
MVKIRLKRFGTKKRPFYRVVVMDAREPRDGRCIEELGTYQPIAAEDSQVKIDVERAKYWLSVGAQPTDVVAKLLTKQAK